MVTGTLDLGEYRRATAALNAVNSGNSGSSAYYALSKCRANGLFGGASRDAVAVTGFSAPTSSLEGVLGSVNSLESAASTDIAQVLYDNSIVAVGNDGSVYTGKTQALPTVAELRTASAGNPEMLLYSLEGGIIRIFKEGKTLHSTKAEEVDYAVPDRCGESLARAGSVIKKMVAAVASLSFLPNYARAANF